ncbi:MAG: alpha-amylase family glycosyl hydrolase [Candidatus Gastranaerophilales bacterium]|nr:alpha-amylase family glycosyl hydrolase [Candidatus Gastranaerophilales bacterium]
MIINNFGIKNANISQNIVKNNINATLPCVVKDSGHSKILPMNYKAYSSITFKGAIAEHIGQGARYLGDGKTRFTLTAPLAEAAMVSIKDDENDCFRPFFMEKQGDRFSTVVDGVEAGNKYFYTIMKKNGDMKNIYDPRADYLPNDIDDYDENSCLSEVIAHDKFNWDDSAWLSARKASNNGKIGWGLPSDMIIESMHVGLLGGFDNAKKELDNISKNGVANAVRIMPIGEFYGKNNWGYDEVAKFAVENSYGRPEDFKEFVNYAHKKGINVILDVVPNHFGPYGTMVQETIPTFEEGKDTSWGATLKFNGEDSKYMRSYMKDMLVNWAVNYHVDGFRFDATQAMDSNDAIQDIVRDLRSHKETENLILYPEDMRISRTMANSNMPKEVCDENWGFNGQTTFDFYKSLIACAKNQNVKGMSPDLDKLAFIYNNSVLRSHEEDVLLDSSVDASYREKCKQHLELPKADADNMLVNISNHDEIGNEAGGKRNMVGILADGLDLTQRCGNDWRKSQKLIFEMVKYYSENGEPMPEELQQKLGCKAPVNKNLFMREFNKAFELNKLLLGAMFMHPSPKEFFMGDDRGELAPLKFFCEVPNSAKKNLSDIELEKGYAPDENAFQDSKLEQNSYNPKWVNYGTNEFSKDFAHIFRTNKAFSETKLENVCSAVKKDKATLEVKRYDNDGHEVIAVMNFSSCPQSDFELQTTSSKNVKELINSNENKYQGSGQYINEGIVSSKEITVPPYGIVVLQPC